MGIDDTRHTLVVGKQNLDHAHVNTLGFETEEKAMQKDAPSIRTGLRFEHSGRRASAYIRCVVTPCWTSNSAFCALFS